MKYLLLLILFASCSKKQDSSKAYQEKLGMFVYNIKDTLSTITINHCDITECLDAHKINGKLYYPPHLIDEIKKKYNQKEGAFIPTGFDLYLTGKKNITAELFDTVLSPKMGYKYLVTGKVTGIKGYGTIFRISSYKKLEGK